MKILLIILSFLTLQTSTYSSTTDKNSTRSIYLIIFRLSFIRKSKNEEALEYFNSSKFLIQKHDDFLKNYFH